VNDKEEIAQVQIRER